MGQVSLLLGAGFSVNKGYLTAKQLNQRIENIQFQEFGITSDGTFVWNQNGREDFTTNYYTEKIFIIDFIKYYCLSNKFNYEEFFDFYKSIIIKKGDVPEFQFFWSQFSTKYTQAKNYLSLLDTHDRIFQQIVSALLKDKENNKFYPLNHICKPIYPGYTGFLNCLEDLGANNIVHIHTLNHDLFFESFENSDWIKSDFSDGFTEMGSPFYGKDINCQMVRLRYFNNEYNKKFRFYKLHGSTDQYPFHTLNSNQIDYIKIKKGIGKTELFKEILKDDKYVYINDWINYHSDFLSGTTSKILRYDEPGYYKLLFEHFKKNLSESNKLIVIGYGCGDIEINKLIIEHLNKRASVFIVDPFPHDKTHYLCSKLNAKLIINDPENLSLSNLI